MAIFHYTVKIVGRSKGKSIISASAYLNGDVMKNEETGRIKRTMPVMESGRKPDHKKTKCTVEKDTDQFRKSVWCIITMEGAIE